MQLSKRTQYGLRAMVCFTDAYDRGFMQTRELSEREKLPPKFLESILAALVRGRFLVSKIGSTGGYRLARPPRDILLGDIVARLEGKRLMDMQSPDANERAGEIAIRIVQERLTDAVRDVLNSTSLADLAEQINVKSRGGQMYYI